MLISERNRWIIIRAVIVLGLLFIGFLFYLRYRDKPITSGTREELVFELTRSYKEFVNDTLHNDTAKAKREGIKLLSRYSYSRINDMAPGLKKWLVRHKVNVDSIQQLEFQHEDSLEKANRINPDNSTVPSLDEFHYKAYIIAQDFIKDSVENKNDIRFYKYTWMKLASNTYQIVSEIKQPVSGKDSVLKKWIVSLKYVKGDWSDKKNWELRYIHIFK